MFNPMSARSVVYANNLGVRLYGEVNKPLYEALYDGKNVPEALQGLQGQELDHAIVHMEQTFVQDYIDGMPEEHSSKFSEEATKAIKLSPDSVVQKAISAIGEDFDFANQDHREAIGKALVDASREKRLRTGSRIAR